mgnify:FL=1
MVKFKMKKILLKLFFFLLIFNNNIFAKPLPPGSGSGDVPANILLLLDTSSSMVNTPEVADALSPIHDVLLLDSGDILIGQSAGVVKMDYSTEKLDTSFSNNLGAIRAGGDYTGCTFEPNEKNNLNFSTIYTMDKSSKVLNPETNALFSGEVIYFTGLHDRKVGVFDADGNCLEIIWAPDLGKDKHGKVKGEGFYPYALTIREIDNEDHLIIVSRERICTQPFKKKKKWKCKKNAWVTEIDIYSKNLTKKVSKIYTLRNNSALQAFDTTTSITMDEGNYLYSSNRGVIHRTELKSETVIQSSTGTTTLNGALLDDTSGTGGTGDSITLTSTTDLQTSGTIKVGTEEISYTGISGNDLTGITRAAEDTREAHSDGSTVTLTLNRTGTVYKPTTSVSLASDKYSNPQHIEIDPQDMNIMYLTSRTESKIQKLSINTTSKEFTKSIEVGGSERSNATPDSAANTDESAGINIFRPKGLDVSNNRVWTGGEKVSIQEYNISSNRIRWVDEMGTTKLNRINGAKIAIASVVQDSTLLQGAKFGFGYWNSGRTLSVSCNKAECLWAKNGEYSCNVNEPMYAGHKYKKSNDNCVYYDNWKGAHPAGESKWCNGNSCLKVGIDKGTTDRIVNELSLIRLRHGTDAQAFAQLASKYFRDPRVVDREGKPLAPKDEGDREECQLNYAIVIGDGKWRHHTQALSKIKALRKDLGVKTIMIAYGDGISTGGMDNFDEMAIAGSCDDPTGEAEDCRPTIEALTPQDLLTKLRSEIQRIIASRLSFTAPSVTANIQEGGDVYQAQFNFRKHGEWEGSLIRKKILPDGTIVHDVNASGNYDAAKIVQEQAIADTRKIWTTLPSRDYVTSNYNNFTVGNSAEINSLFGELGGRVSDYHSSTSECGTDEKGNSLPTAKLNELGIEDGNSDDIKGLIKFVRGYDYFAYEGCSNINNVRNSVLGDIYHSQIVEVGKPKARTSFIKTNEEAYWRKIKGYDNWAKSTIREKVLYVGANDGALHAFYTSGPKAGQEAWAFVPPFIAAKLPNIVNQGLDGISSDRGGSNAIFGVDGSPVVHDMFVGLDDDGNYSDIIQWQTILFIPYGRGGAGFSVLLVTNPDKPHHLYSVFNDRVNNEVKVADKNGNIRSYKYTQGSFNINESLEALKAAANQQAAKSTDLNNDSSGDDFTRRDAIATCESNPTNGKFFNSGTNACFRGSKFTFLINDFPAIIETNPSLATVIETNETGDIVETPVDKVEVQGSEVTFHISKGADPNNPERKIINYSDSIYSDGETTNFSILLANSGTEDPNFNYSSLGETWGTPRIIRMPIDNTVSSRVEDDVYVAVLPGGYGAATGVGSSLFLINLEDFSAEGRGSIFDAEVNNGPISIIDLENDVPNSIPTDPIVVTPDTFRGIDWRGAMVYLNDFEGKITKINLTNQNNQLETDSSQDLDTGRTAPVDLYDQTTLFNLNANQTNGRFTYFPMDAGYGNSTRNLWLFGGTGDFSNIGSKELGMDNVLYGIRDRDFPNFRHSINGVIPSPTKEITNDEGETESVVDEDFKKIATTVALAAPNADDERVCADSRNDMGACPGATKEAWIFKLETGSQNFFRKASASPTIFGGIVYYPVYEPPHGSAKCAVGSAFVCAADDECGINQSEIIASQQRTVREESKFDTNSGCYYLQPGILSKLVVSGDQLIANITTDSEKQEDTLIQLLGSETDLQIYRGSWRENY